MTIYGATLVATKVDYYPATFGGHTYFGSDVVMNVACDVILQDHMINVSCDFMSGSLSS